MSAAFNQNNKVYFFIFPPFNLLINPGLVCVFVK